MSFTLVLLTLAQAAPTPAASPTPKQVCRSTTLAGSRLPIRMCATPAEWASYDNETRRGKRGRASTKPRS